MKKILVLSCSALALSVAAVHAQGIGNSSLIDQIGGAGTAGNFANVAQNGDYNSTIIDQSYAGSGAQNKTRVLQVGDDNIAGATGTPNNKYDGQLTQNGSSNDLYISQRDQQMIKNVTQEGDQNYANIQQYGNGAPPVRVPDHRVWKVTQKGQAGAAAKQNDLTIDQRGDSNVVARAEQENTSVTGGANVARIIQRGLKNGANINNVPPDVDVNNDPYSHGAVLKQKGSANETYASQDGERNNFWLESTGDGNIVTLEQDLGATESYANSKITGDMNNAAYKQTGDQQDAAIIVDGSNFVLRTDQSGASNTIDYSGKGFDGKVSIEQSGAGNNAKVTSDGTRQYVALKQDGNNNGITIEGLNGPALNKFYVWQQTSDNMVTVGLVDGSYNRLEFVQKGGDGNSISWGDVYGDHNKLFFTQDGSGNSITGKVGDRNDATRSNGNRLQVAQIGDDNETIASITGSANMVEVVQYGDMNMTDVSQTGDNNHARVLQGAYGASGLAMLPTITTGPAPFTPLAGTGSWQ